MISYFWAVLIASMLKVQLKFGIEIWEKRVDFTSSD
jgi:hypothetical protein